MFSERRNMKALVVQGGPWLTVVLAAMYFGIIMLLEVLRVREDPDQERSRKVHIYFVNAIVFGVTAGYMLANRTGTGSQLDRFWMIAGLALYVLAAYGVAIGLGWVPIYDRILMIAGGVSCLLYLCSNNTWYRVEVILVGIAMLVVAVTLVVRAGEGWIRFLVPRRQASPNSQTNDHAE